MRARGRRSTVLHIEVLLEILASAVSRPLGTRCAESDDSDNDEQHRTASSDATDGGSRQTLTAGTVVSWRGCVRCGGRDTCSSDHLRNVSRVVVDGELQRVRKRVLPGTSELHRVLSCRLSNRLPLATACTSQREDAIVKDSSIVRTTGRERESERRNWRLGN